MANKPFHKIFSLVMALLVLLSTVSFTIGKHFCGNELITVSMFAKADHCGIATDGNATISVKKKSCCSDVIEVVQGQDKLKMSSFEDFQFEQQVFLATFECSDLNRFEGLSAQIIPHKNYAPPQLIADIQVLGQVFII